MASHQHHNGFMSQQLFKVLSRLARHQHHKLGHVFVRVARTPQRSGPFPGCNPGGSCAAWVQPSRNGRPDG